MAQHALRKVLNTLHYIVLRMENVSVRLDEKQVKELAKLQKLLSASDNSTVFRYVLDKGIRETKIQKSLEAYKSGEASLEKAAALSGLSYWEFLDEMARRGVYLNYSKEDFEEDAG